MIRPSCGSTNSFTALNSTPPGMPNSLRTTRRSMTALGFEIRPKVWQVADYLVSNTDENRAFLAVDAIKEPTPLWHPAYTALVGVYYLSKQPRVPQAFQQLMGPRTVGEQMTQRSTWSSRLTDDTWFYYGSRFGEYLGAGQQPDRGRLLAGRCRVIAGRIAALRPVGRHLPRLEAPGSSSGGIHLRAANQPGTSGDYRSPGVDRLGSRAESRRQPPSGSRSSICCASAF